MTDEPPREPPRAPADQPPAGESREDARGGGATEGQPAVDTKEARRAADAADRALRRHPLVRGFVLGAILTAAIAAFIVQNTQSVSFEWLWFDFGARLWLALLVAFGLGLVVAGLASLLWRRAREQRGRQRRLLRRWTRADQATATSAPREGGTP